MKIKTMAMTLRAGAKLGLRWTAKNLPTILTIIGTAGVITGTIAAAKAAPEAKDELDAAKLEWEINEEDEGRTKSEYVFRLVRIGTKHYWVVALIIGGSIACFWFANHINLKRLGAALTVAAVSRENLKDIENKILELDGEKKLNKIKDEVAKDRINNADLDLDNVYGVGEHLCYDPIGRHYFMSDIEKIKRAERMVKEELRDQLKKDPSYAFVHLSDFLNWCGDNSGFGDLLGFQVEPQGYDISPKDIDNLVDEAIDISGSSALKDGSIPVFVIGYDVTPKYAYDMEGWHR